MFQQPQENRMTAWKAHIEPGLKRKFPRSEPTDNFLNCALCQSIGMAFTRVAVFWNSDEGLVNGVLSRRRLGLTDLEVTFFKLGRSFINSDINPIPAGKATRPTNEGYDSRLLI